MAGAGSAPLEVVLVPERGEAEAACPARLPRLLGRTHVLSWGKDRGHVSEPCMPSDYKGGNIIQAKVKNTFIEAFANSDDDDDDHDDEDSQDEPPALCRRESRSKTCPDIIPHCKDGQNPSEWHMLLEVPVVLDEIRKVKSDGASKPTRKAQATIEPIGIRKPSTSLGSDLHGTGSCRPCAWYWRTQGCQNGEDCLHCHLCPLGEVKARRKSKRKQCVEERASADANQTFILRVADYI